MVSKGSPWASLMVMTVVPTIVFCLKVHALHDVRHLPDGRFGVAHGGDAVAVGLRGSGPKPQLSRPPPHRSRTTWFVRRLPFEDSTCSSVALVAETGHAFAAQLAGEERTVLPPAPRSSPAGQLVVLLNCWSRPGRSRSPAGRGWARIGLGHRDQLLGQHLVLAVQLGDQGDPIRPRSSSTSTTVTRTSSPRSSTCSAESRRCPLGRILLTCSRPSNT